MKYTLAFYDPVDPDAPIEFTKRRLPSAMYRLRRIVAHYNKLAENDPDVILALGIFPAKGRKPKRKAAAVSKRQAAKRYRLAIFDLCDESLPLDFVGKLLGKSPADQAYVREAISEYNAWVAGQPGCSYAMALFEVG